MLDLEEFIENPSVGALVPLPKSQWARLATHFQLEVRASFNKAHLQNIVLEHLVDENIFSQEEVEEAFPAFIGDTEGAKLSIERDRIRLELLREQNRAREMSRDDKAEKYVPPFCEKDPEDFFSQFEKNASIHQWPLHRWAPLLSNVFTGAARQAYTALTAEESRDYSTIKSTVLRAYERPQGALSVSQPSSLTPLSWDPGNRPPRLICPDDPGSPHLLQGEVPLCRIYLQSPVVSGYITAGIVDELPVDGVSLVLGNVTVENMPGQTAPSTNHGNPPDPMPPKVSPVCVVTRSASRRMASNAPSEPHPSKTTIGNTVGHDTLSPEFFPAGFFFQQAGKEPDPPESSLNSDPVVHCIEGTPVTRSTLIAEQARDPPTEAAVPLAAYVKRFRERMCIAQRVASENLQGAQVKMKAHYDQTHKVQSREFHPGDQVLVFLPLHLSPFQSSSDTENNAPRESQCLLVSSGHEESVDAVVDPVLRNSEVLQNPGEKLAHLPSEQAAEVLRLLQEHPTLFHDNPSLCPLLCHDVDVKGAPPIRQPPYRLNAEKREVLRQEVQRLLEQGLIEPSLSPWASPVVMVPKSNGKVRMCVDYRKVNAVTVPDSFPLPRMDDIIDDLGRARYVSKFDLLQGYYQLGLTERASQISAFITPEGLYHFKVLPFGMRNAPSSFQRLMNHVVMGLSGVRCYLDDLVVFSDDWGQHLQRLRDLFQRLTAANLTINPNKE
ncbi:hypothetical protein O3P69_008288 [Scylla paramamosain]|uniref:Reverse transcriptase domain-containing protein n=1 Tax=Scylla paramamosain TaxID=85552 RepID=A0AAW0SBW4_SCYPA